MGGRGRRGGGRRGGGRRGGGRRGGDNGLGEVAGDCCDGSLEKKKQEKNESIHFKSAFLKRLKFKFLREKSVIKEHCTLTGKCQLRVFRIQHSQWKYGIHKNEKAYCHNKRLCAAF